MHERVGRHRHHRRRLAHAAGDVRRRARRPARRSATSTSRRMPRSPHGRRRRRRLRRPHLAVQHLRPHRWASSSDKLGRKQTYFIFFVLGVALYVLASFAADWKILALFVGCFCVIASMYGGGFATIPAYLADMFGTQFVGAIHGRLLTAWSTAGIVGPVIVNYMHDTRQAEGIAARPDLRADLLHPGRHAGGRLHRQPAGATGRSEVAHERSRGRRRAGQVTSRRHRARRPVVRHRHGRRSTSRRRYSGCSSASRWPGASGTQSRRLLVLFHWRSGGAAPDCYQ